MLDLNFFFVRANALAFEDSKTKTEWIAKCKRNQTHQEMEGGENPNIKLILDYKTPPNGMKTIY